LIQKNFVLIKYVTAYKLNVDGHLLLTFHVARYPSNLRGKATPNTYAYLEG